MNHRSSPAQKVCGGGREGGMGEVADSTDIPVNLARAFPSNYPEFPDSCLARQFAFGENVR